MGSRCTRRMKMLIAIAKPIMTFAHQKVKAFFEFAVTSTVPKQLTIVDKEGAQG